MNRSYWPDAEASGQLLTELCEDLASDFDITVLVGQPNHNPKNEEFCKNRQETHHGVTIERVIHPQWGKRFLAARAVNLIGFLLAAAMRAFRVSRPDIVVVETDPFLLALLGRCLKWWHGCRFVVYLQDLYPDVAVALGKVKEGWLTRFLRWQLKNAYRQADRIVVLSGDMKNRLIDWGLDGSRIIVIENWVDTSTVYPVKTSNLLRQRESIQNQFVVMHSGNMGLTQYLDKVLDAAALLNDRPNIEILLVGDGARRRSLEAYSQQLQLKNLRFLPYQPRDELNISLSAADLHLISMHAEAHHCLMPSKFYGILASGTAVLAMTAENSELTSLIREHKIGIAIRPGDPQLLADQLRWCSEHLDELREMGQRARKLAMEHYDRKRQTNKFGQLLHEFPVGRPATQTIQHSDAEPTTINS